MVDAFQMSVVCPDVWVSRCRTVTFRLGSRRIGCPFASNPVSTFATILGTSAAASSSSPSLACSISCAQARLVIALVIDAMKNTSSTRSGRPVSMSPTPNAPPIEHVALVGDHPGHTGQRARGDLPKRLCLECRQGNGDVHPVPPRYGSMPQPSRFEMFQESQSAAWHGLCQPADIDAGRTQIERLALDVELIAGAQARERRGRSTTSGSTED